MTLCSLPVQFHPMPPPCMTSSPTSPCVCLQLLSGSLSGLRGPSSRCYPPALWTCSPPNTVRRDRCACVQRCPVFARRTIFSSTNVLHRITISGHVHRRLGTLTAHQSHQGELLGGPMGHTKVAEIQWDLDQTLPLLTLNMDKKCNTPTTKLIHNVLSLCGLSCVPVCMLSVCTCLRSRLGAIQSFSSSLSGLSLTQFTNWVRVPGKGAPGLSQCWAHRQALLCLASVWAPGSKFRQAHRLLSHLPHLPFFLPSGPPQ